MNNRVLLRQVSWVLYAVGIAGILGSWVNLVSPTIGWIAWVIAMAGWGMQFLPGYKQSVLSDELQKLANLHDAGKLSDDEYERAKQSLLDRAGT